MSGFLSRFLTFYGLFFGLVVPDSLEIITYDASEHIQKSNLDQQTFLDELMLIMKNLRDPLWTLRLNLNIIGFLKTTHQSEMPTRLQIQEPCSFIAWGGPDETGFQNFSISYHLFSTVILEGEEQELWSLKPTGFRKGFAKVGTAIRAYDRSG